MKSMSRLWRTHIQSCVVEDQPAAGTGPVQPLQPVELAGTAGEGRGAEAVAGLPGALLEGEDPKKGDSPWNSLELTKLAMAAVVAGLVTFFGFRTTAHFREVDEVKVRREAVQQLSRAILERRARSELLASSMRRHAQAPIAASMEELLRRKKDYDETYVSWNANYRGYMLALRQAAQEANYTPFEKKFQYSLTNLVFKKIDDCLTIAYDGVIRQRDPRPMLDACGMKTMLSQAQNCGYALTEQPHLVTGGYVDTKAAEAEIAQRCPMAAIEPVPSPTLSGTVTINGVVEPGAGVERLELRIRDAVVGQWTAAPANHPIEFVVDTARLADGPARIELKATDRGNRSATSVADVNVSNGGARSGASAPDR
jgi:hypothetical protein